MSDNKNKLHKYYILEDGNKPYLWLRSTGVLTTMFKLADTMTTQDARDIARVNKGKKPYSLYNEFHELVDVHVQESATYPEWESSEEDDSPCSEPVYHAFYINKDNPELAIDYLEGESGYKFPSLLDYVDASTINPVRSDELGAFNLDNFYVIRSEKDHITLKDVFRVVRNSK